MVHLSKVGPVSPTVFLVTPFCVIKSFSFQNSKLRYQFTVGVRAFQVKLFPYSGTVRLQIMTGDSFAMLKALVKCGKIIGEGIKDRQLK